MLQRVKNLGNKKSRLNLAQFFEKSETQIKPIFTHNFDKTKKIEIQLIKRLNMQ